MCDHKVKLEIPVESDIRALKRNMNNYIIGSSFYSSSVT